MTNYDYSAVLPVENNWLSTTLKYSGLGTATFRNPKGTVTGKTEIVVDENGSFHISMVVETIDTEDKPLPLGLQQLLSKDPPREINGKLVLSMPFENNTCNQLKVVCSDGYLLATEFDNHSGTFSYDANSGVTEYIRFHPSTFEFRASEETAKYWAIPLNNFVSDFQTRNPLLSFHPLRIFPSKVVPNDTPADIKNIAEYIADQKNSLIVFTYLEELGFIEALPNYEERVKKLKSKEALSLITAVMVGGVSENSIDYVRLINWFPTIFIDLLSFVSGVEVGVPWIELRGDKGQLIRRYHTSFGFPTYVEGARIINEALQRGTGELLSKAFACPDIDKSYLRTTLRMITKGGRYSQSVEDKMNYLCRSLETLAAEFGFQKQNLLAHLDPGTRNEVRQIVKQAITELGNILHSLRDANKFLDASYLQTIQGRVSNSTNTDLKFGLSVLELLRKFNLPDAKIVDAFLNENPRPDGINDWATLLSVFRGRTIHVGYFDFRGREHDINDIWTVIQHLHDILARIILMILGYTGKYQPTVAPVSMSAYVNWVKNETPVGRLGYAKDSVRYHYVTISKEIT